MTLVVFAGPTLTQAEIAARRPGAIVLPPARQGDVWRAVQRRRPAAIGLIDGLFRGTRAVWHREILWALSEGVHVLGAASMGALRAAELHPFGMRGIGRVFAAYRSGVWPGDDAPFEDDDEVAVEHAPAELAHAPLSTAMVDLRDTLLAAETARAIDGAGRRRLAASLKALHYPERSLARLDEIAGAALSAHAVPRKALDALDLLDAAGEAAASGRFAAPFRFQRTAVWDRFVDGAERDSGASDDPAAEDVLDQLRLDPPAWRAACLAAEGRLATRGDPAADLRRILSEFREARGLQRREDLARWMAANRLDEAALLRLLRTDPDRAPAPPPAAALLDELRATGAYAGLLAAAERRHAQPVGPARGPEMDAALDWYFPPRIGAQPASLAAYAAAWGWPDEEHFRAAVLGAFRVAAAEDRRAAIR